MAMLPELAKLSGSIFKCWTPQGHAAGTAKHGEGFYVADYINIYHKVT